VEETPPVFFWRITMLSREDFVFTIGYDGAAAIVDGRAKRQYGGLSTMELAETGLYRAAFASALFELKFKKDESQMKSFISFFNAKAGTSYENAEQLQRLFGLTGEAATRVIVL
jgi:hypothetical protein